MLKAKAARKKQSFLQGTIILTAAMFLVKVIGALYKIPLSGILGPVGNSYFSVAYAVYAPLEALSTAGLPIAISKLVSENIEKKRFIDVRNIHKVSIPIFLFTGIVGTLAMLFISPIYCNNFCESPQAQYAVWAMAPTVFFVCLMSIYRGYYQGLRNMLPTAISEIIEAISKFALGLAISYAVVHYGMNEFEKKSTVFGNYYPSIESAKNAILAVAAAGAILGVTIGALCSFLFLFISHKLKGDGITNEELSINQEQSSNSEIFKKLVFTALPIGLGAIIMNFSTLVDASLVLLRLNSIMDTNGAVLLSQYGDLISNSVIQSGKTHNYLHGCFGYATTIMMLIPALTQVFGISALPSVSEAWTSRNFDKIKQNIETVLKITMLVTIPAGLGLAVLSNPITNLVYGGRLTQSEIQITAGVLNILGFAAIFTSTSTPICSMLQAIGRVDLPVKILSIGVIIKILVNYVLVGIPEINIQGAGTGTLVCYAFVTTISLYMLCKETKVIPNFKVVFVKPLLSGICSSIAAYASYGLLSHVLTSRISTLCSVAIAVLVYVIALFAFRAITVDDIKMIPGMKKFLKILEKRHNIG